MDYERAKLLLFHHVDVVTNIKRARDFGVSDFVPPYEQQEPLTYSGYLKVIDPISKSVILAKTDGISVTGNVLILGQNICDILQSEWGRKTHIDPLTVERILENDSQIKIATHPYFHRPQTRDNLSPEELQKIQKSIMDWFKKYFIPIELNSVTQELIVAESVRIRPPYEHESDYISPTRVALKRIKYLVDSRPKIEV